MQALRGWRRGNDVLGTVPGTLSSINDRTVSTNCRRADASSGGRNGEAYPAQERLFRFSAIEKKDVLFKDAAQAVHAAARRGPVGIASGARIGEIRHILGGAGLLDCFSVIVAAEDVQRGKPDPEPFRLAWDRLKRYAADLTAEECVAVEDSLGGIQSALSAGMPVGLLTFTWTAWKRSPVGD
jgi:HAD superfamily hydrolase (TIGR01509 family)